MDRTWFVSACVTTSVYLCLYFQRVGGHVCTCIKCLHEHTGMCLTIDKECLMVVRRMRMFMWDTLQKLRNELFARMRMQSHFLLTIGVKAGLLYSFFLANIRPLREEAAIWLTCKMTNHSLFCLYVPFRSQFTSNTHTHTQKKQTE